jgi:sigma-B regulation protein RsbU (phosphoserine phosphatase)
MAADSRPFSAVDSPRPLPLTADTLSRPITRMLIVDDDAVACRLLQRRLEAEGYTVRCVANNEEAIVRLDEFTPDVVFLDVALPRSSGLDVLQLIRSQALDMAVIVMTAHHSEELVLGALRCGADDYVSKPFDRTEFETEFERVIGRLSQSRQNAVVQHHRGIELARAAEIQADLLPRDFPAVSGFEVAACCLPAREIGGDFYDWHPAAGHLLNLTVGDVMGKGLPAALLMASVRGVLRAVGPSNEPAAALQSMASTLSDDLARSGAFVTIFHSQLDAMTGVLNYVDAGHGYTLLRRASGRVEPLHGWSLPLGVDSDEVYEGGSVVLNPGDLLLVYTDGLREARPELWTDPEALSAQFGDASASSIVDAMIGHARTRGPLGDDVTLVALRRAREH